MPKVEDDNLAKQYLLGELSEHELEKVEEQYFEDDEVFERLSVAEEDLVDAYALNQLSAAERKRFEQRLLLSPAQRERLQFARTLLRTASDNKRIESNIPQLTPAASWWVSPFTFLRTLNPIISLSATAMLILALLAGWWLIQRNRVTRLPEQQAQQTNTSRPEQVNQGLNQNSRQLSQLPSPTNQPKDQESRPQTEPRPESNRIFTFALVAGMVRDAGDANRLVIPSDASMVRLSVTIEPGDYRTYLADLRRPEGEKVWRRGGLYPDSVTSGKGMIVMLVPAGVLKNGDYILTLSGTAPGRTEVVSEYSFRVVRN